VETDKLGSFLRKMRKERRLSLRDLEKLSKEKGNSGLNYSHISKIENGDSGVRLDTLQKIAAALDLPFIVLLDGGNASPDTVTVLTTEEISSDLIRTIHREEIIRLLLVCQNLTEDQINSLRGVAESMALPGQPRLPQNISEEGL
jgi:transcriptional regulator with XRE-family HTH domain